MRRTTAGGRAVIEIVALGALFALAAGCKVGPNYVRPKVNVPRAYKEAGTWKVAHPGGAITYGSWWTVFDDPTLNSIEARVSVSNQNVALAEAQVRSARAAVRGAQAAYYPTIGVSPSVTLSNHVSSALATSTTTGGVNAGATTTPGTVATGTTTPGTLTSGSTVAPAGSGVGALFVLPLQVSWEADVWGRVRRNVESNQATAQATAGDLAWARLSAQAALAQAYYQRRALDEESRALDAAVVDATKIFDITMNRYRSGVDALSDVLLAQSQLETTRAQAIDIGVQRATLEHAMAVLIGEPASTFSLPAAPLTGEPPAVPLELPSELVERRPDVAAAERRVAAANAQIGVAQAAYFPQLGLSASGGLESTSLARLFSLPSFFWSVGPTLSQTLFDGGLRGAQTAQARAAYDAAVATYRQAVLVAFQEVEDELATLRILEGEAVVETRAVAVSRRSLAVTMNQYKAGTVGLLEVMTAKTTLLTAERSAADVLGRRMVAMVLLIQALGGGWRAGR